jgi:uncharacterized protein YcbK (DUF882 family)
MKLSPNFEASEFRSKDGADFTRDVVVNIVKLCDQLEVIRRALNAPIIVTSGYRSPEHNKAIGGSLNSFHVKGMAVDFKTNKHTPEEIAKVIELLIEDGKIREGGLGIYKSWVHYDIRGYSARWNG